MGGHVLWLDTEIFDVLKNITTLLADDNHHTIEEFKSTLEPLMAQAKMQEQACIIKKMYDSGMTVEEISFRLGRDYFYIKEICNLDSDVGYDYAYIKGASPLSKCG